MRNTFDARKSGGRTMVENIPVGTASVGESTRFLTVLAIWVGVLALVGVLLVTFVFGVPAADTLLFALAGVTGGTESSAPWATAVLVILGVCVSFAALVLAVLGGYLEARLAPYTHSRRWAIALAVCLTLGLGLTNMLVLYAVAVMWLAVPVVLLATFAGRSVGYRLAGHRGVEQAHRAERQKVD